VDAMANGLTGKENAGSRGEERERWMEGGAFSVVGRFWEGGESRGYGLELERMVVRVGEQRRTIANCPNQLDEYEGVSPRSRG
jgi:hypothetical protein